MDRNMREIQTTIKEIICRELQIAPQAITEQINLREIPGIESLKFLRVILRVEEHYGIELEENVVFSIETLNGITAAVVDRLDQENVPVQRFSIAHDPENSGSFQNRPVTLSSVQSKTAVGGGRCA